MSHSPPVPAANTSPFPLHEAPHEHATGAPSKPAAAANTARHALSSAGKSGWALPALAGVGAAALAATAYFVFVGDTKASGKKQPKSKAKRNR